MELIYKITAGISIAIISLSALWLFISWNIMKEKEKEFDETIMKDYPNIGKYIVESYKKGKK